MKFILLINVKIPTIVVILTFIGRINGWLLWLKPEISINSNYSIVMNSLNFMLSRSSVEHLKYFIFLGPEDRFSPDEVHIVLKMHVHCTASNICCSFLIICRFLILYYNTCYLTHMSLNATKSPFGHFDVNVIKLGNSEKNMVYAFFR